MLISVQFGNVNTGQDVYYRVLNPDQSIHIARTNTDVFELVTGSGCYVVEINELDLCGRIVVWDIDNLKIATESFYDLSPIAGAIDDLSATTTVFVTTLPSSVTSFYVGAYLLFTSGLLAGQARSISAYNGTTKSITLSTALTSAPTNNDRFIILGRSGT